MSVSHRPCPNCGGTHVRVRYVEPPFEVVRCRACGLVYLSNPPDEEQLYDDYYRASDPDPNAYRVDAPDAGLAELYAINEQRVAALQELGAAGLLLDVGCGRGFFLETARRYGFTVEGLDVADPAARYARQHFGLAVQVGSLAETAHAAPGGYDVVTLWHVLEHFLDPFDALRHVRALLAEGGVCVAEVPNLYSLKFLVARQKWQGGNHPRYHRTFFSARTLQRAFRDAGFRRVRRLPLSYHVPGRSRLYERAKRSLNRLAMDAFLAVAAWI